MRPTTFRGRLATRITALCLVVLAVAGTLIYFGVRRTLHQGLDQSLIAIARSELASEFDEPGVGLHVHPEAVSALAGTAKIARITDAAGTVRAATPNLAAGPPLADDDAARARALAGTPAFANLRRGTLGYRGVYYPLRWEGAPFAALVALPTEPIERSLRALAGGLALALAVAGVTAAFASVRLARRLTAPLERIAEAARAVPERGLSARIPTVSPDAELAAVTAVLNQMLDALERAVHVEQQATAAQRRFVSDAAHELRSPLTNVRGTIEVTLRRPRAAAEYEETLRVAGREIERLCRLADDLLTLSRAEAGGLAHHPAPCDAVAIVDQALHAWSERAAARHVRLARAAPPTLPIVADADRLRQVIDNLIDNGLRYAPPETDLAVTVAAANGTAAITVADRGPGLTADQQAHVFDRFYRVDDSRARSSGGSGLGLAIAKAIVDAHHGTIAIDSTPGAGCAFVVRLPRTPSDHAAPSEPAGQKS